MESKESWRRRLSSEQLSSVGSTFSIAADELERKAMRSPIDFCRFVDGLGPCLPSSVVPFLASFDSEWKPEVLALAMSDAIPEESESVSLLRRALRERTTMIMDQREWKFVPQNFRHFLHDHLTNRSLNDGWEQAIFPQTSRMECIDDVGHAHTCAESDRVALFWYSYLSLYRGRDDAYEVARALNVASSVPSLVCLMMEQERELIESKLGPYFGPNVVYHCLCTQKNETARALLIDKSVKEWVNSNLMFLCAASYDNVEGLQILWDSFAPWHGWTQSLFMTSLSTRVVHFLAERFRSYLDDGPQINFQYVLMRSLVENGNLFESKERVFGPSWIGVMEDSIRWIVDSSVENRTCEDAFKAIDSVEDETVRTQLRKGFKDRFLETQMDASKEDESYCLEVWSRFFSDEKCPGVEIDRRKVIDALMFGQKSIVKAMVAPGLRWSDCRGGSGVDFERSLSRWSHHAKDVIDEESITMLADFLTSSETGEKVELRIHELSDCINIRGLAIVDYLMTVHGFKIKFDGHEFYSFIASIEDVDLVRIDEFVALAKKIASSERCEGVLKIQFNMFENVSRRPLELSEVCHFAQVISRESEIFELSVYFIREMMHEAIKTRSLDVFRFLVENCLYKGCVENIKRTIRENEDSGVLDCGTVSVGDHYVNVMKSFSENLCLCAKMGFEEGIEELKKYVHWKVDRSHCKMLSGNEHLFDLKKPNRDSLIELARLTLISDYDIVKYAPFIRKAFRERGINPKNASVFKKMTRGLLPCAIKTLQYALSCES